MKKFKLEFNDKPFYLAYITELEDLPPQDVWTSILGLDIETMKLTSHEKAGLDPYQSAPRLIQIYNGHTVFVFDCLKLGLKETIDYLNIALEGKRILSHYALFEIAQLSHKGFKHTNIDCTLVMSRMLDCAEHCQYEIDEDEEDTPNEEKDGKTRYKKRYHTLDDCAQREFGAKVSKHFQNSDWNKSLLEKEQVFYAGLDAVLTYELAKKYSQRLLQHKMMDCYELYKKMQLCIVDMHRYGVAIDWDKHQTLIKVWEERFFTATVETKKYFGEINLASSKQMNEWAKKTIPARILTMWPLTSGCLKKIELAKKTNTPFPVSELSYSFTQTSIAAFKKIPQISALAEWKKYQKLLTTYGQTMATKLSPVTGRLHPTYTLAETATSRLSSRDPNIQNQPRDSDLRSIFVAAPGNKLVICDFSQIEVRVQAERSLDPVMRKVYADKGDIYRTFAATMYHCRLQDVTDEQRQKAKTAILALAYGMGPTKLVLYALNSGVVMTLMEAEEIWKAYHETFCVYSNWCNETRHLATVRGYATTLLGKRRKLEESEIYTRAPNHDIQGTAAELLFLSSTICKDKLDKNKVKARMILSCHDEIGLEARESDAEIALHYLETSMCEAMKIMFPNASSFEVADAGLGNSWVEAKKDGDVRKKLKPKERLAA